MNTTETILDTLREKARLEPGLSEDELSRAEEMYGFRFPLDLRELLEAALPLDHLASKPQRFPDWRAAPNDFIRDMMSWPLKGLLFDVEHSNFWLESWGVRPVTLEESLRVAQKKFSQVPKLIPVYAHRYLPAEPCESGNPIFSVYQTDVIYYGHDLLGYFRNEFFGFQKSSGHEVEVTFRRIPFWSFLAEGA